MKHQAPTRTPENSSAGQNLRAQCSRFSIAWQPGGTLELGQQVEDQQHGPEGGFGSEEVVHAKSVGPEIMLQLGNPVLHIRTPVVIAPDFFSGSPENYTALG